MSIEEPMVLSLTVDSAVSIEGEQIWRDFIVRFAKMKPNWKEVSEIRIYFLNKPVEILHMEKKENE